MSLCRKVLVAIALSWLLWYLFVDVFPWGDQLSVFFSRGKYVLWDHVNLRQVVDLDNPYLGQPGILRLDGDDIARLDIPYPALCVLALRAVPNTLVAGWVFSVAGIVAYLASSLLLFRRFRVPHPWTCVVAVACSIPVAFSVHVGNMISFASASALLFLAWYDAPSRKKRCIAACALALAFVLKISPVLLGVLYLGKNWRNNFRYVLLSSSVAVILLLVPFYWCGGVDGFWAWIENARENAATYALGNGFGVRGLFRELVEIFDVFRVVPSWVRPAVSWLAIVFSGILFASLVRGKSVGVHRLLLAALFFLFTPPTMMCYCSLLLLPLLLVGTEGAEPDASLRGVCALAYVALACPLQIPLLCGSLKVFIASVATIQLATDIMKQEDAGATHGTK